MAACLAIFLISIALFLVLALIMREILSRSRFKPRNFFFAHIMLPGFDERPRHFSSLATREFVGMRLETTLLANQDSRSLATAWETPRL